MGAGVAPGARPGRGAPGSRTRSPTARTGTALVELAGPAGADVDSALEAALGEAVEAGLVLDAAIAGSPPSGPGCGRCASGCRRPRRSDGPTVKHDVSVPITGPGDFVARTGPPSRRTCPGIRLFVYGHVGDGNLHYNLSRPRACRRGVPDPRRALSDVVNASVAESVGSISAEHGLGRSKAAAAAAYKSDVEVSLMRAVKDALDPPG